MTEEDKNLLNSFEGKLRHVLFLYDEEKKENAISKQSIVDKDSEIQALLSKI